MTAISPIRTTLAAGAVAAIAAALSTAPANAAGSEKCYGIALAGQNSCAAGAHECAGRSMVDYDPASFKYVPKGTCAQIRASLKKKHKR